ncbi:ice-binding family protein [Sphaerochaeta sp. S2]|uniref:ice-binding family protein n=1 Tax=Sphaerochaeta sp. S2 TaxID=2798868 RepID=UPI0018E970F0|nr:ice-binding family protein [Sphaerochaeta sp. S2]MBJ2355112.1 DUF3494 domain-containing protein [Sphaerochaeta sp. S2]
MNTCKNLTKYVFLFAIIGILSVAVGCSNDTAPPTSVTGITVTGASDATSVANGETLQMSAAVLPADALDMSVTWSVIDGTGTATISESGLLSATSAGSVTVKAIANDGSEIEGTLALTVTVPSGPVAINLTEISGVTLPARDATPDTDVPATDQYTATISWDPADSPYLASTVYTATITLTAKTGYTLSGIASNSFTVLGATTTNAVDSGVVTAVFPETTDALLATVPLGTADNYVILAESAVSTTGATAITGDLGLSPAATSAFTGFSLTNATGYATSDLVTGKLYASDMAIPVPTELTAAVSDVETAYTNAAGRVDPNYLNYATGAIGGKVLPPALYKWTSAVGIGDDLTLNGGEDEVWIFQISGKLDVASDVTVLLTGGALAENVFWQVTDDVTLGAGAHMEGIILGKTQIILQTGSSVNGRLLAQTQVTLDAATVVEPVIL